MAYLQPMIMWGGATPTEEDRKIIALSKSAKTHSVFQEDPDGHVIYVDQHHLGHPAWQKWFLNWVRSYIQDYGADGVYHDQSYKVPMDCRGLAFTGMTSSQGAAEYFYKAAAQNPGSIHGTEHLTEVNSVGASLGIASGILWGMPETMRHQRIRHGSPVSNALHYPNAVMFGFPHFSDFAMRRDATHFHWGMDLMEKRAEIAGMYLQNTRLYFGKQVPYDQWVNELKLDRARTLAFVRHGLRPVFPESWDRNVRSYFRGAEGEDFRYEDTPWGSRFVQVTPGGKRMLYGRIHGVRSAAVAGGVKGWVVYNRKGATRLRADRYWDTYDGPTGLHPDRYYCLDPSGRRPAAHFSATLEEGYVEDGVINEHFALLRVRPIEWIGAVTRGQKISFHSPAPPKRVYVNGKELTVQSADARTGRAAAVKEAVPPDSGYVINMMIPADICVVLKDPEPGPASLKKTATVRMVSNVNSDIFDAAWVTEQTAEAAVKVAGAGKELPAIVVPSALSALRGRDIQTHLMFRPPADGTLKIHVVGRRAVVEEFAVNGVARDIAKDRRKAGPLELPLAEGKSVVLSLTAKTPLTYAFEWIENPAD